MKLKALGISTTRWTQLPSAQNSVSTPVNPGREYWLQGSRKVSGRKQPESGPRGQEAKRPRGQDPSPPARVAGGGKGGLPERAAVSNPAITKKGLMSGAISDGYACPPAGSAIPRPGSSLGPGLASQRLPCAARLYLPLARESAPARMRRWHTACESHTSVLCLWFFSPGSQVLITGAQGECSCLGCEPTEPKWTPTVTVRHTH